MGEEVEHAKVAKQNFPNRENTEFGEPLASVRQEYLRPNQELCDIKIHR